MVDRRRVGDVKRYQRGGRGDASDLPSGNLEAAMEDDATAAEKVLGFLSLAERLKRELRHSWLSDGRRESVAEHTWFIALLALLTYRRLEQPVSLERVLSMAIVHDLAEVEVGDIPYFEVGERKARKAELELAAIDRIAAMLPAPDGDVVKQLWLEFEHGQTPESKFVRALDHLEVQVQHNLADLSTWEPIEHGLVYTKMDERCAHDGFLRQLLAGVRASAETKMREGGVDVDAVRRQVGT
jgi:5'-deoxynucleotidase YfbR-like HD superfamily hydrolase